MATSMQRILPILRDDKKMRNETLSIATLFGNNVRAAYSEDFRSWESVFNFTLTKEPSKENLLALLPAVSERDGWRLRLLDDAGDDLFDIRKGDDMGTAYDVNKLRPYHDAEVKLGYTIEKTKAENVLTLYDLTQFLEYVKGLAISEFYNALYNNLQDGLILEIWGEDYEQFSTATIAVIKKGDALPSLKGNVEQMKRVETCGQYCQWAMKLPRLLPEDLHIVECVKKGGLAKYFCQACLLLSVCFVADFSVIEKRLWRVRMSGFKTLVSESNSAQVADISLDESSVDQWFEIYDWCYTGGYTSDRLVIARNIISLNCPDTSCLRLNESTLGAIKSNFRIFEQDNVRQYIKVRNDVSKDLLALQDKINSIVEGFTGDFRKSVVGLGTFFLTLVVVRVAGNGQWAGAFSSQVVALSFLFIVLSAVVLVYSRLSLERKERLYDKHYKQLQERYEPLLSKEEADKIFEDSDPKKVDSHSNYIQWQKNRYTWIWALTLVAFAVFLVAAWCYNLFETTNVYKIIKTVVSCCTKNI